MAVVVVVLTLHLPYFKCFHLNENISDGIIERNKHLQLFGERRKEMVLILHYITLHYRLSSSVCPPPSSPTLPWIPPQLNCARKRPGGGAYSFSLLIFLSRTLTAP